MADPDLKKNMPWSVKGVSKEARDVVKKAAAEQGLTMGEWLSQAIRGELNARDEPGSPPEPVAPTDGHGTSAEVAEENALGASPVMLNDDAKDLLRRGIAERIAESEERILNVVEPLQEIIQQMAVRIEVLENREARAAEKPQPVRLEGSPTYRKTGWDD